MVLRDLRGLFFFFLFRLTTGAEFGLLALLSARGALSCRNDINDYFAVVFAASWACAVREACGATFALCEALPRNSVVAAPLCGLGTILAHSDYHMCADYTDFEPTRNREQKLARWISESPHRAIADRWDAVPYPLWT